MSQEVTPRSLARTPGKPTPREAKDDADQQPPSSLVAAGLAQPNQAVAEVVEVDPRRLTGHPAALARYPGPLSRVAVTWLDELQLHARRPREQEDDSEARPLGDDSVADSGLGFRRATVARPD
jgi:hypothetical protein